MNQAALAVRACPCVPKAQTTGASRSNRCAYRTGAKIRALASLPNEGEAVKETLQTPDDSYVDSVSVSMSFDASMTMDSLDLDEVEKQAGNLVGLDAQREDALGFSKHRLPQYAAPHIAMLTRSNGLEEEGLETEEMRANLKKLYDSWMVGSTHRKMGSKMPGSVGETPLNFVELHSVEEVKSLLASADRADVLCVLYFWRHSCMGCRASLPNLVKMAKRRPDCLFLRLNITELPEIAEVYDVTQIPTAVMLRGEELGKMSVPPTNMAKFREKLEKLAGDRCRLSCNFDLSNVYPQQELTIDLKTDIDE